MREDSVNALEWALRRLIAIDSYLLQNDANERSLSHRLALHLQTAVDSWGGAWHVDCEYNRDVERGRYYPKKLGLTNRDLCSFTPTIFDEDGVTVFPDVIVHKRGAAGRNAGNLLVVEVKKSTSHDCGTFDKSKKLPAYCDQLGYQNAAFVLLKCRDQSDYEVTWIRQADDCRFGTELSTC